MLLPFKDVRDIVGSYVQYSDLTDAKMWLRYKGNEGYPVSDCISLFLEKNSLPLKDATKLNV